MSEDRMPYTPGEHQLKQIVDEYLPKAQHLRVFGHDAVSLRPDELLALLAFAVEQHPSLRVPMRVSQYARDPCVCEHSRRLTNVA